MFRSFDHHHGVLLVPR